MLCDNEGQSMDDQDMLKSMVNSFYIDLFRGVDNTCSWFQTQYSFPRLDREYLMRLGEIVLNEEVKQAIFSMGA